MTIAIRHFFNILQYLRIELITVEDRINFVKGCAGM